MDCWQFRKWIMLFSMRLFFFSDVEPARLDGNRGGTPGYRPVKQRRTVRLVAHDFVGLADLRCVSNPHSETPLPLGN